MKKFDYCQPASLKEAYRLMEKFKGAKYIAGGTDLIVRIKQKDILPDALISLRNLNELTGIRPNGGLYLGSMTRFRDIEREPVIAREYSALKEAASVLASPQIRNAATIGGNICNSSPCADSVPPLMVMEARLILEGPGGVRDVAIEEFFNGPGANCMAQIEVLKAIKIPDIRVFPPLKCGTAFLKTRRTAQDLAIASAAVLVVTEGNICRKCRIAAGSVAPVPIRLKGVEKFVEGQEISPELLDRAARETEKEVSPISDVRSTEQYRRLVMGVMVRRAIQQSAAR